MQSQQPPERSSPSCINCLQQLQCIHGADPSYLTNLCVPVATNTSRRCSLSLLSNTWRPARA